MHHKVRVSSAFRKQVSETIQSIIVFIIVYILLILFALGLTGLAGYAGFMLILFKPMFMTLMIGLGLIIMGLLVLIFLVKFMFHKSKADYSGLTRVARKDAPDLFALIDEVATEVGTQRPKKVFLYSEVNAYVFYDSSFWSMFFPIRKNLTIGLGLMNSLTVTEFKAILAHEFGHFSQRSMKIGSYTYNVNKVIFNMLYENDSYSLLKQQIAGWSSYIVFFANIATGIIGYIQKILQWLYKDINVSYSALSREMEFHADEIAASVTGSAPMIAGLLRLDIASDAYQQTIQYYNGKISDSVKTNRFFQRQKLALEQLGKEGEHAFVNGFPLIRKDDYTRYNRSKLVIVNQWASHPSTLDRITALEQVNLPENNTDDRSAMSLLPASFDEEITSEMFATVNYAQEAKADTTEDFSAGFAATRIRYIFPKLFNGYYDARHPAILDTKSIPVEKSDIDILYSKEVTDKVYSLLSLSGDISTLEQIAAGGTDINTVDYDGEKYTVADIASLLEKIKAQQETISNELKENDHRIYGHFASLEMATPHQGKLETMYQDYVWLDKDFDEKYVFHSKLREGLGFTQQATAIDEVELRFDILRKNAEADFKTAVKDMLTRKIYTDVMEEGTKSEMEKYTAQTWGYFFDKKYDNEQLERLFAILNNFAAILSKSYYHQKQGLLLYFAELHEQVVRPDTNHIPIP